MRGSNRRCACSATAWRRRLKAAIALEELVEKFNDVVSAQAEEIDRLKVGQRTATGLLDERTGHVVGLTLPVYSDTPT